MMRLTVYFGGSVCKSPQKSEKPINKPLSTLSYASGRTRPLGLGCRLGVRWTTPYILHHKPGPPGLPGPSSRSLGARSRATSGVGLARYIAAGAALRPPCAAPRSACRSGAPETHAAWVPSERLALLRQRLQNLIVVSHRVEVLSIKQLSEAPPRF